MKFLVCISVTPDTTSKIAFTEGNTKFAKDGVQFIINPADEWYALVRAIELKEKIGGTVTVINVGPAANDVAIRKALAIGADDAVRVDLDANSALNVATQIAAYAKAEAFDVVFFGKETIDYNGSEISAMTAELLDLPFVSYGSKIELDGNLAIIEREIEGGTEVVECSTPLVVSAAKGMAEQRIPNMQGIMKAKMKPLKVVPAVAFADVATISTFALPAAKTGVKLLDPENMDELVRLLHEEAKVI